ncbi:MAG: MarR family winged helix-turn-helix transcriptional regulator [Turicibacter sp.]
MNVGYGVTLCSKLLRNQLNKELEQEGITAQQFAVLKDIERHESIEEYTTSVLVATRLDMDKPTISGIVNRLIEKELISKSAHPKDKRAQVLKLTHTCHDKLLGFEQISESTISSAIEGLDEEQINMFKVVLERMISNLRN